MSSPSMPEDTPAISAADRLHELLRAYQRQLKRRPTTVERVAMQRAALLTVRAEAANYDAKATSNDIVRLDNAARRARADFERLIAKPVQRPSMADIEQELRKHAV